MKINAEISYGELFDKISILKIKKSKIKDKVFNSADSSFFDIHHGIGTLIQSM